MTMPRYFDEYEENNSSSSGASALLTFVLGAAAGVAAGMLLAPSSGQENRRKIANAANDWANKAESQWDDLKANATSTINQVAGKAESKTKRTTNPTDKLNNV